MLFALLSAVFAVLAAVAGLAWGVSRVILCAGAPVEDTVCGRAWLAPLATAVLLAGAFLAMLAGLSAFAGEHQSKRRPLSPARPLEGLRRHSSKRHRRLFRTAHALFWGVGGALGSFALWVELAWNDVRVPDAAPALVGFVAAAGALLTAALVLTDGT